MGFDVPLYTATAWGGACAPEDTVFPLWGGYAFRPWMFYDGKLKEHPATAEYLYGDFHNNSAPKYYNFDPEYAPEDFPYACCEMGGRNERLLSLSFSVALRKRRCTFSGKIRKWL